MKKLIYTTIFVAINTIVFAQQNIAPQNIFVLTPQERILFTPPYPITWGTQMEDYPLHNWWDAFNHDTLPVPLSATAGPAGWYQINGAGSQNHALLWMGESSLAYALAGDVVNYEVAAKNAIILLDSLDFVQGHMRDEAIGGYIHFWEGGIAGMAMAGLYAPAGSTSGPHLLMSARKWWANHIAVMRLLRMPDGQVAQVGARMNRYFTGEDDEENIRTAVNLQLIDPQPYNTLHPNIAALLTVNGQPLNGLGPNGYTHWHDPRHVAERWIVLRAFQSGALLRVPANQPVPSEEQDIYKWTVGNKTYVATPKVRGFHHCRFEVSWTAGSNNFIHVEVSDSVNVPSAGKGPWLPPLPLNIPTSAVQILGPVYTTANPTCAGNNSCGNDAAVMSIVKPYHNGCLTTINPQVVIKNNGTIAITELAIYYQIDNNSLYSQYNKGAVKSKRFSVSSGPGLLPDSLITLTLDASTVVAGTHTLKVWIMDVNKITDINATNDLQTIQFDVVGSGYPTTYSENFESIAPGQIPNDWSLYNPDANQNWFVYSTGTNKAAAFNNYAYTGAKNAKDELVMPVIDLTGNNSVLSFDLSHASRPASIVYDSLEVMISTDCGNTFTSVWGKGGTALNTVADNANLFVPAGPQDYQNIQINLSAYNSSSSAIIKFVNWSNNGNSTLIDNVNFQMQNTTGINENNFITSVNVFPNPASESAVVTYQLQKATSLKMKLVNSMGRIVEEINLGIKEGNQTLTINIKNYAAGIYNLILISGDEKIISRRVVVAK